MIRGRTVLAVLRYEWETMISLKSGLALLFAALLSASSTVVTAASLSPAERLGSDGAAFTQTVVEAPMGFLAVMLYVFGALSLGNEYRYRRLLVLHVIVPRRHVSYLAKLSFALAVGGLGVLAVLAVGVLLTWTNGDFTVLRTPGGTLTAFVSIGLKSLAAALFYVTVAFSTTALTGSTLWGLLTPVLASSIVEAALLLALAHRAPWLSYVLPFSAARQTLGLGTGTPAPGGLGQEYAIIFAWSVALALSGGYRYVRREC